MHWHETIQGKPAAVDATNRFTGAAAVASGSNVVTVEAVDSSGNGTVANYQVGISASSRTFTYDANGNLTADGSRTFEWDARNQLLAVNVGTHRTEFVYDGLQRRVRIIEIDNGVTTKDSRFVWCKGTICEQRAGDGATVERRFMKHGEQVGGAARLFVRDHLGSVSAVTDGAVNTLARYEYDPWGRRGLVIGTDSTAVGFTGHWFHAPSELWLTQYRAYDADLGRWISEDPIKHRGDGPNLSAYVLNEPVTRIDPLGLQGIQVRDDFPQCAVGPAAAVWFHHRRGTVDDRYAHCLASCLIAKTCGQDAAKAAEDAKERLDLFLCYQVGRQGNCESAEQKTDYADNARGRDHAKSCPSVDCRWACNDLKGKGPGDPGPHANANKK